MRITFDYQVFGWQKYGGVSRYFFELSRNISKLSGTDVSIVCPLFVNSYLRTTSSEIRVTGVGVPDLPYTGRLYRAFNQFLAPPLIRRFNPDIVHETYYSGRTCVSKTSKVVLTVFDMIHERFPEFYPNNITRNDKISSVARADHIICISEATRQDLIKFMGVKPERTSVVHLGFSLSSHEVNTTYQNLRPYILYVGSRSGYKNFELLLRSYANQSALNEDFDLIAFGGGPFSDLERSLISSLGLSEAQVWNIQGADTVLASLYSAASLFVYPSLYEGFGIPPLEAMSFDCPVACSAAGSLPEVVGDAAMLFDPNSIESIGMAMLSAIENSCIRQSLIERGRERIKLFSWQSCAERTMDIYSGLLT